MKVPIGEFGERKRGPWDGSTGARGGELRDRVRKRAGPDTEGPCAPSKGVWFFFEMHP